ncbi:unnamed protein product, partial [Ectocarpus sp. 13 AM-2016]
MLRYSPSATAVHRVTNAVHPKLLSTTLNIFSFYASIYNSVLPHHEPQPAGASSQRICWEAIGNCCVCWASATTPYRPHLPAFTTQQNTYFKHVLPQTPISRKASSLDEPPAES